MFTSHHLGYDCKSNNNNKGEKISIINEREEKKLFFFVLFSLSLSPSVLLKQTTKTFLLTHIYIFFIRIVKILSNRFHELLILFSLSLSLLLKEQRFCSLFRIFVSSWEKLIHFSSWWENKEDDDDRGRLNAINRESYFILFSSSSSSSPADSHSITSK